LFFRSNNFRLRHLPRFSARSCLIRLSCYFGWWSKVVGVRKCYYSLSIDSYYSVNKLILSVIGCNVYVYILRIHPGIEQGNLRTVRALFASTSWTLLPDVGKWEEALTRAPHGSNGSISMTIAVMSIEQGSIVTSPMEKSAD
jgi:hypothetical protein